MASIPVHADGQKTPEVKPEEVYYGINYPTNPPVKLRIATGGAGQSHLVQALADAFIEDHIRETGCEGFAVAWIKSDTTESFNHIADGTADLAITYHEAAEKIAIKQGVAERRVYAWRDHFVFAGPKSNTANLPVPSDKSSDEPLIDPLEELLDELSDKPSDTTIQELFSQLFIAAIASDNKIRFLSRFDKSATNIKESAIWAMIGQTPWSNPISPFYHIYTVFPYQALATAAELGEYTLTDRGTWYGAEPSVREKMQIYLEGKDDDKTDTMLNPAHVLVGANGDNKAMADAFADWIGKDEGGQKVVSGFKQHDVVLYTHIP